MRWRSYLFQISLYSIVPFALILSIPFLFTKQRTHMAVFLSFCNLTRLLHKWIVGVTVEIRGWDHLPAGPVLVAAKHQSTWDTLMLQLLFKNPATVLKKELFRVPIIHMHSVKGRLIEVDRKGGKGSVRKMLKAAKNEAAQGRELLIFPEGNRKEPGAPPDYKPGVALLYSQLNLPCVPIALNSGLFWPRREILHYPGKIIVELLPPIKPGIPPREFMKRLETEIETASDRLIREAAASPHPSPRALTAQKALEKRLKKQAEIEHEPSLPCKRAS